KYTVPLEYTNKETSLPKENKIDGEPIISPLVGTFYAAPGEGKEHFVEVGSNVKKGDILCIIEAMKVMNEIKAIKNGKVTAIQVKNGETVQYGDILMYIV
ncbi:MAG: acetyl-CoA carboxylase, biotin carboxyl carrier protein, partial [Tenericutes bacterium]|nr:acetyl-CoA carboxylase, biotin carboxyl carrier protein [Mycoplasmatota bacterium]